VDVIFYPEETRPDIPPEIEDLATHLRQWPRFFNDLVAIRIPILSNNLDLAKYIANAVLTTNTKFENEAVLDSIHRGLRSLVSNARDVGIGATIGLISEVLERAASNHLKESLSPGSPHEVYEPDCGVFIDGKPISDSYGAEYKNKVDIGLKCTRTASAQAFECKTGSIDNLTPAQRRQREFLTTLSAMLAVHAPDASRATVCYLTFRTPYETYKHNQMSQSERWLSFAELGDFFDGFPYHLLVCGCT